MSADGTGERISTSRLLSLIRGAGTPEDVSAWHDAHGEPALKDALYELISRKGLTPKEMIRRCGIERSYFYHILSGVKCPGRNVLLRICLCAGTGLQDVNRMLRLAGAPALYARIRRDALIIYAIQRQLGMEQTNQLLMEQGEDPLYRDEKNA